MINVSETRKKRLRNFPAIRWLAILTALCSWSALAGTLSLSKTANYQNAGLVRPKVLAECLPEQRLPVVFRWAFNEQFSHVDVSLTANLDPRNEGFAIVLTIVELILPPATGWSNQPRVLRVNASLYRQGALVAEVRGDATARGAGSFIQKVTPTRLACDYVEGLMVQASQNAVGRMRLMNLFARDE